jgi:hypothetical protein
MLGLQEDYHGMVELDSYSSVDWSGSVVNHDEAEGLKSNSPRTRLLPDIFAR